MEDRAPCLEESTIWRLLHRGLDGDSLGRVRGHLDRCAGCRAVMAALTDALPIPTLSGVSTLDAPDPVSARVPLDSLPLAPGATLAGKYRIDAHLGAGGMGVVFAATHQKLGTRVAIKLLRPDVVWRDDARARFLREARAAARIKSAHVVKVADVDTTDDGSPFLVMELLEGSDLSSELRSRGPLPVTEAVSYVVQAAHALADAHANGIVHRDLKPANLYLARSGSGRVLKVLDFGMAKELDVAADRDGFHTVSATWLGTPRYMAPEQLILGRAVDARVDVWGLGTVLYHLVANDSPFGQSSVEDHVRAVLEAEPRSLDEARPDVPPGLSRAVTRCLAKDPADRFGSMGELARALAPYGDDVARALAEEMACVAPPEPEPRSGRPRVWMVAGAVAVVTGGIAMTTALVHRSLPVAASAVAVAPPSPSPAASPADEPGPSVATSAVVLPPAVSLPSAPSADRPPRGIHVAPRPRNAEFGGRR